MSFSISNVEEVTGASGFAFWEPLAIASRRALRIVRKTWTLPRCWLLVTKEGFFLCLDRKAPRAISICLSFTSNLGLAGGVLSTVPG